jgi:hypothetical protein
LRWGLIRDFFRLGLDTFDKNKHTVIQQYDIYGVLGFIEGFRGK